MRTSSIVGNSLDRQAMHWQLAARRMSALENMVAQQAWMGVDAKIARVLQKAFSESIAEVISLSDNVIQAIANDGNTDYAHKLLLQLRNKYTRTEETIHYYTIAINSRTSPGIAALLRACDILCHRSMELILKPLGKTTPLVMTYVDKGIGASILKAGLRLWDGKVSAVAVIKITQHNLYRPTAIIHETGHQVAHILNWTEELEAAFKLEFRVYGDDVANAYAGWVSEMAADAFAFVHTGYAAVVALHDVVSGGSGSVFAFNQYDPHPISYIRVLLNIGMCRRYFGTGPWDQLEDAFRQLYPIEKQVINKGIIMACEKVVNEAVRLLLEKKYACFGDQSLASLIPPQKVSPAALEQLESTAGPALYTSHAWIAREPLRLLAINGYRIGCQKGDPVALYKQQEEWMTRLGYTLEMN